jgi:hypothetical protein
MVTSHVSVPFETTIPKDTTKLEVWFHSFSDVRGEHCEEWDSQSGQNYWFDVAGPDPLQPQEPVRWRVGAVPGSPDLINVLDKRAMTQNVFSSAIVLEGGFGAGLDLRSLLAVRAWVRDIAYDKKVWIDVHVFDASAILLTSTTLPLTWETSSPWSTDSPKGDIFRVESEVYQGATASLGGGSVQYKPDARHIQFRAYYEANGQIFTDAILHQLDLPDSGNTGSRGIWVSD